MRAPGSTEIMIISPIDTTNKGPMVPDGTGGRQPVHLKQGEMDGACGLYSLMMGFIICGVVRYEVARSFHLFHAFPSEFELGKLLNFFKDRGLLISGIDLDKMFKAVDEYSPGQINCQGLMRKGYGEPALVEFIEKEISENHPVLLLITLEDGGRHWVLVIGCEYKKAKLRRFLILDPEENPPQICSWNGVIDTRKQKGAYPYRWWRTKDINDVKVQLEYALAIWPKKNK